MIMEYIFSDDAYRKKFLAMSRHNPEDFHEFCNLLINDMNSLLFDGLLALEEIKTFEELKANVGAWAAKTDEEKEQLESSYKDESRKAKGTL